MLARMTLSESIEWLLGRIIVYYNLLPSCSIDCWLHSTKQIMCSQRAFAWCFLDYTSTMVYYGASFWEGQPLTRVSIPKVSSFSLRVKTIAVLKRTRVRITCGYLRVWQFGSLRPQNHVSPSTCHSFMSLSEAHIICLFPETIKSVCLKPWVYPRTQPFRLRLRTKAQKVGPWGLGHIKLEGWVISGSTPLQTLRAMLRQREPSTSSKSASKTWSPVGFAHRLSRTWQRLRLRPWRKRCTAR